MAATRSKAKRGGKAAKKAADTSGAKATAKAAKSNGDGGKKREAARKQAEAMIKKVVAARGKKNPDSWAVIGEALGITPGKAQYLNMLHLVAEGEVPKIPNADKPDSAAFAKSLEKARKVADEHSSWGWLSARAGLPEGKIKAIAKEAGFYEVGKENIAAKRAGTNGSSKKSGKKAGKAKRGR